MLSPCEVCRGFKHKIKISIFKDRKGVSWDLDKRYWRGDTCPDCAKLDKVENLSALAYRRKSPTKLRKCRDCGTQLSADRYFRCHTCHIFESDCGDLIYFQTGNEPHEQNLE